MGRSRFSTFLAFAVLGVGAIVVFVVGLFAYVSLTARPLHPDANAISSAMTSPPADTWSAAAERGRQIARDGIVAQNLPGLSVAVGVGGDIAWAEGFGWADLERQAPVTPESRFRIGTASIVLTSAAVGLLLERERLKLDQPIQTYVPEFPAKEWPVTLRQLMAHVAGVRNDGGDEGPLYSKHCERPVEGLEDFKDRKLLFEPGTRYRFSSYGWILVSAAVEAAAEDPFLTFMRREVFEPLGMEDTRPDSASEPVSDRVTPYFPRFGADPRYGPDPMRPVEFSCYAGASVFLSTPSDLVRFGLAINGGKLLKASTVKLLQEPQKLASGEETGYGLGWDLETVTLAGRETRWTGHDGTLFGGMAASLITFPERGLVVSVISNTSYAEVESLAVSIAQAFSQQERTAAPAAPRR